MFTMIQPLLDAIQEVTVSTATPGLKAAGQGAVQIKFVTRSGNNEYHGSLYEYHQNKTLNANNWFYNRDRTPTYDGTETPCTPQQLENEWEKCKAPRNRLLRNQFGFWLWNFDLSLVKKVRFTEQSNLEFRGEFLNAFNQTNFNGTSCASTSQTCGQVSGQQGGPRAIQLVLRINF